MIIIMMGVSGAGKTTVGMKLSQEMGWPFYEGDRFHPTANIKKMSRGIPLTDQDRRPWLEALRRVIEQHLAHNTPAIIACSALKASYRQLLQQGEPTVQFIYLRGDFDLLQTRMQSRQGHFMQADMLANQLDTLEEPADALIVDIAVGPEAIVREIRRQLQV